jgi:hypothetical protein
MNFALTYLLEHNYSKQHYGCIIKYNLSQMTKTCKKSFFSLIALLIRSTSLVNLNNTIGSNPNENKVLSLNYDLDFNLFKYHANYLFSFLTINWQYFLLFNDPISNRSYILSFQLPYHCWINWLDMLLVPSITNLIFICCKSCMWPISLLRLSRQTLGC